MVKTSNFIGDTLDMAATAKFEEVLLVGHVGKLVKLAAGVMNTHSRGGWPCRGVLCPCGAVRGPARSMRCLMDAATTDACLDILDGAQLRRCWKASAPPLGCIWTGGQAGPSGLDAVLFSNQRPAERDKNGKELMQEWQN